MKRTFLWICLLAAAAGGCGAGAEDEMQDEGQAAVALFRLENRKRKRKCIKRSSNTIKANKAFLARCNNRGDTRQMLYSQKWLSKSNRSYYHLRFANTNVCLAAFGNNVVYSALCARSKSNTGQLWLRRSVYVRGKRYLNFKTPDGRCLQTNSTGKYIYARGCKYGNARHQWRSLAGYGGPH